MNVNTLIIGYHPTVDEIRLTPAKQKEVEYYRNIYDNYNFGKLYFADVENFQNKLDKVNPIIVIVFDNHTAEQVKNYKKDCFVYVTETYRQVIRNKSEDKEKTKFAEIEGLAKKLKRQEEEGVRKYCAMDFKQTYDVIVKMLTSDDPEIVKKAYKIINLNHGDWPWIRAKIMIDCWQSSDGKGKEEFLTMTMERYLKAKTAKRIEDATDESGLEIKQYKFKDGSMYKIPVAEEKMDGYKYESIFDRLNPNAKTVTVNLDDKI